MKKMYIYMPFLIIAALLTSCKDDKQEVIIQEGTEKIKINNMGDRSIDWRYVQLLRNTDDEKSIYVFDTIKGEILLRDSNKHVRKFSAINYENDKIKIVDNHTNATLYDLDLVYEGFMSSRGRTQAVQVSDSGMYLFYSHEQPYEHVFIDLRTKSLLKLPLSSGKVLSVVWSSDENKAVIVFSKPEGINRNRKTYIWDIHNDSVKEVAGDIGEKLSWTPGNAYIWYSTVATKNAKDRWGVIRYSLEKESWEEVYATRRSMFEDSIKWISDHEFVYLASEANLNPLARPYNYFAVKVDVKNNKETDKKLSSNSIKEYTWSSDNKYIYYLDENVFYKEEVNY